MMRGAAAWTLVVLLALFTRVGADGQATPPEAAPTVYRVLRVVDGDTVALDLDGRPTTVRLIGVDSPETVHPGKPVERFGREAARFLQDLIGGKPVRLSSDPGSARRDRYGRTLAYLYLEPDGLFVNREIVARGYGHAYTVYPFRYMDDFRAAERSARERRLGLWAPGADAEPDSPASPETTMHVTRTGAKYHRDDCRALTKGATPIPLGQAVKRYQPCALCKPPTPARTEGALP